MKLISLTSNINSFNPIFFNEKGLTIIAAIKKTNDKRKTYNSVGKSLAISLIHFCLGSSANEEFKEKLPKWEFILDFKIDKINYSAKRSTLNQEVIILNGEEKTIVEYKNFLASKIFSIPNNSKFISFRGLISRFIRPTKYSYNNYNKYVKDEDRGVTEAINNSFLLGLDIHKILKKADLKKEFDDTDKKKKNIEKDDVLRSFFKGDEDGDVDIEMVELETEIKRLKNNLKEFNVAEDFYEIQKDADVISSRLKGFKNKASRLKIAIGNVEKSLNIKPDITKSKLLKFYKEASIQLGEMVIKQVSEVEKFNKKLLSNRSRKLLEDKDKFTNDLSNVNNSISKLGREEDEKLKYLNAHGALEEYTKLNNQLSDKEKRFSKLENYQILLETYQDKIDEIDTEIITQNTETRKYLKKIKETIDENIKLFKSFVDDFYDNKSSGISILSNEGKNKVRYDIKAKIADDSGDSVNEIKIFCYDWTILKSQHNHKVKFLFHDSRITDGLDLRQLKTLFEVAYRESKESDFQYIISLNEFAINNLRTEMETEEGSFDEIITNNIELTLSDKSDEEKLLGIQVDLSYQD